MEGGRAAPEQRSARELASGRKHPTLLAAWVRVLFEKESFLSWKLACECVELILHVAGPHIKVSSPDGWLLLVTSRLPFNFEVGL